VAALANRGRAPLARGQLVSRRLRAPEWPREIAEIFAPQPPGEAHQAPLDEATIWEAYLSRMLGQRWLSPAPDWDEATARRTLAWLAAWLRDGGETEFRLDRLAARTAPSHRTPHRPLRRALHRAASSADRRLQAGTLDLARWLEARRAPATRSLANWLRDRAARARPGTWLRRLPEALIQPAEELGWPPERVPSLLTPLAGIVVLPAVTAFAAALGGWPLAVVVAPASGLLWGLNLPWHLGLRPRPRRRQTAPNESVRRSARHAAVTGLVTAAALGAGLLLAWPADHALGGPVILAAAAGAGVAASISNGAGACARHYAARVTLTRAGVIPWRFGTFLDAMTERTLLHRSGSGYLFIHRLLAEHLVLNHTNPVSKLENATPGLANTEVIPVALPYEPAYRADQPPPQRVSHRAQ